jgi:DNA polymerase-3 subunit epsilon
MDGSSVHTRKKGMIVADTETTGLLPYDRIATLAGGLQSQSLYLIF